MKVDRNQDKAAHVESRRAFYDWLTRSIPIPGIVAVERDTDFDDEKLRSAGIRLVYPTTLASLQGVKSGVLLEVGFDDTAPNRTVTISSWAYDTFWRTHLGAPPLLPSTRAQPRCTTRVSRPLRTPSPASMSTSTGCSRAG